MWWMKVWGYLEDRPAELSRKQLPIKKRSIWANVSLKTNMMVWVLVRHHSKLADIPQLVAQGEMSLIHYMLNPRPWRCWRYALPVETRASCRIGKGLFSVILSCFNSNNINVQNMFCVFHKIRNSHGYGSCSRPWLAINHCFSSCYSQLAWSSRHGSSCLDSKHD